MRRLGDYGVKNRDTETLRIEDLGNEEVTIQSAEVLTGQYGDYVVMQVIMDSGEMKPVMSGGIFVVDAVTDALQQGAFPLLATFSKRGRSWLFE